MEMLWYLAGGFATIGGSGSVFGMDYYVLPVLKKYWKNSSSLREITCIRINRSGQFPRTFHL